eukprot:scaffold3649_cov108-Isochrysis_galbana.AAC.3
MASGCCMVAGWGISFSFRAISSSSSTMHQPRTTLFNTTKRRRVAPRPHAHARTSTTHHALHGGVKQGWSRDAQIPRGCESRSAVAPSKSPVVERQPPANSRSASVSHPHAAKKDRPITDTDVQSDERRLRVPGDPHGALPVVASAVFSISFL